MRLRIPVWHFITAQAFLLFCFGLSGPLFALESCPVQIVHQGKGPVRTLETYRNSTTGESLLFAGEGAELVIYDVTNPGMPTRLGAVGTSGPVMHIAINASGTVAAVSDARNTITLVRLVNRTAPMVQARYQVPEGRIPRGLSIQGNTLYAAITPAGPAAFNITDPAAPTLLQQIVTPGTDFVFDMKGLGSRSYVADDLEGVTVWDTSNPGNMQLVRSVPSIGASRISIAGTRALVAKRNLGFDILDISSVNATPVLGSVSEIGSYSHGVLVNNHLVTAAGFGGLRTFNISTVSAPLLVSTVTDPVGVNGVAGLGNSAWIWTQFGTSIKGFDFTVPATPVLQSTLPVIGASQQVHANAGRVYVPQFPGGGLAIFNNAGETRGELLGRYTAADIYEVAASGNLAYVASTANDETTLRVLNVSNPAAVTELAALPLPTAVRQMAVTPNRLWIALPSGVRVYDVSNPSAPSMIASTTESALSLLPSGNRLYIGQNDRIKILDTSAATPSFSVLGQFSIGQPVNSMVLQGNLLFVGAGPAGLRVLNVANAAAISSAGSLDIALGGAYSLAINGNRLFIGSGPFSGTVIVDISTPTAPLRIGNFPTPADVVDVAFGNGALIAAEDLNGVRLHYCIEPLFANGFE